MRVLPFAILALTTFAACGNTERPLRDLRAAGGGPDEFAVILGEPLQIPEDTSTLPPPTPRGVNRADPSPRADAIAALGGSSAAQIAGGIPDRDARLVAFTSRYGVDPAIRSTLAAEDAVILQRARRLNVFNPFNRDRYFPAYRRQALDARAELNRLQKSGVVVPTIRAEAIARPERRSESIMRQLGIRDDCVFTNQNTDGGGFQRVCEDDTIGPAQ